MAGADGELAQRLLEKAKEPNVMRALVEVENLHTRNVQRWVRLDAVQLIDFPELTLEYLRPDNWSISNKTCAVLCTR